MPCLHAVTDDEGLLLDEEDESGMRLCTYWSRLFESRTEDERHHAYETTLEFVQKAPEDTQWTVDKEEFDEMIATEKESAPGPDGIPNGIYRCAGGLGSRFEFNANNPVVEGGSVTTHPAARSFTVDDNGLIVRSPDVLRPLTLCNCDWQDHHHCDLLWPPSVLHDDVSTRPCDVSLPDTCL